MSFSPLARPIVGSSLKRASLRPGLGLNRKTRPRSPTTAAVPSTRPAMGGPMMGRRAWRKRAFSSVQSSHFRNQALSSAARAANSSASRAGMKLTTWWKGAVPIDDRSEYFQPSTSQSLGRKRSRRMTSFSSFRSD